METIRKMQFIFTGYRNFTKWSKPLPPLKANLQGQNYVITGANSGIGFEAAKQAAFWGANVYLICRNEQRGKEAIEAISKETGNKKVYLVVGQMGEKGQMSSTYKQLRQKVKQIDILIHNAGCMLNQRQFTKDKLEKNFASNTFAVYFFTNLCLQLLHEKSRVIVVSSGGMLTQPLSIKDYNMEKQDFDGTKQYAINKRQQVAIVEYFANNYHNKGKFVSMHPGWVDTPAIRSSMPDFYAKMKDNLKQPPQGADTINYLASVELDKIKNGQFYFDREVADKHLTISCTGYDDKERNLVINKLKQLSQ